MPPSWMYAAGAEQHAGAKKSEKKQQKMKKYRKF
jgi:hypothetical protein